MGSAGSHLAFRAGGILSLGVIALALFVRRPIVSEHPQHRLAEASISGESDLGRVNPDRTRPTAVDRPVLTSVA